MAEDAHEQVEEELVDGRHLPDVRIAEHLEVGPHGGEADEADRQIERDGLDQPDHLISVGRRVGARLDLVLVEKSGPLGVIEDGKEETAEHEEERAREEGACEVKAV